MFRLKSQKLRAIFLLLFLGIFFGKNFFYPDLFFLFGIIFFVFSISLKHFYALLFAFFCFGNFYGQMRNSLDLRSDILPHYYEETLRLKGVVVGFPDKREKNNRVFVKIFEFQRNLNNSKIQRNLNNSEIQRNLDNSELQRNLDNSELQRSLENLKNFKKNLGLLLLVYDKNLDLNYGDKISFLGKITEPKSFNGFDYLSYLKQFKVQSIVRNPVEIKILAPNKGGNFFIKKAKLWRDFFENNLAYYLPDPHQKIAMGILLGVKNELPKKTKQDFKNSGLQHLLVVSGFNITIIMTLVGFFLRHFGSRVQFIGLGASILFFVAMVGGDPPVLRAAIFGIVLGWAVMRGRLGDSRNLIWFTAVLLALYSPQMIQNNAGFWLSFFATMGIILGVPIGQKIFKFIPEKFNFRSLCAVIFSAQIAVFPILALYFGNFPFGGFLANFLAEPLVPLGMFFSFFLSFGNILPDFFVHIFAFLSYQTLNALIFLAHFFGQFGVLEIPKNIGYFSLILVLLFFLWGNFSNFYQRSFLERP